MSCMPCGKDGKSTSKLAPIDSRLSTTGPREGALRVRCQDCGARLETEPNRKRLSDNPTKTQMMCYQCRNEALKNESVAIKIKDPMNGDEQRLSMK